MRKATKLIQKYGNALLSHPEKEALPPPGTSYDMYWPQNTVCTASPGGGGGGGPPPHSRWFPFWPSWQRSPATAFALARGPTRARDQQGAHMVQVVALILANEGLDAVGLGGPQRGHVLCTLSRTHDDHCPEQGWGPDGDGDRHRGSRGAEHEKGIGGPREGAHSQTGVGLRVWTVIGVDLEPNCLTITRIVNGPQLGPVVSTNAVGTI